jgi:hypothetical protein
MNSNDLSTEPAPRVKRVRVQRSAKEEEKLAPLPFPLLLSALGPVRLFFHGLLTDQDAGRLMRVNGAFISSILFGFLFRQWTFFVDSNSQLHRLSLYARYGLQVASIRSSPGDSPLTDSKGRSLLPPSLISLMFGHEFSGSPRSEFHRLVDAYLAHPMSGRGYDE